MKPTLQLLSRSQCLLFNALVPGDKRLKRFGPSSDGRLTMILTNSLMQLESVFFHHHQLPRTAVSPCPATPSASCPLTYLTSQHSQLAPALRGSSSRLGS